MNSFTESSNYRFLHIFFPFIEEINHCFLALVLSITRACFYKGLWTSVSGADPGFQVRGGTLKKIAPSGGRRENFWGISCEKSGFYAKKKSYFFQWIPWIRPCGRLHYSAKIN